MFNFPLEPLISSFGKFEDSMISAKQIAQWAAGNRAAQGLLPILIRRLIHASGTPTSISVPGGDSVGAPGWDGIVESNSPNAWVVKGKSYWEFGCDVQVTQKANKDFNKRRGQVKRTERVRSTFNFVSPRKWTTKDKWLKEKNRRKLWRAVRAYDADDLEQWLERAPAVAIWFAEKLGIAGVGLRSTDAAWGVWAKQTAPEIASAAFLLHRDAVRDQFLKSIEAKPPVLTVRADSAEEAAAFVAACLNTREAETKRSNAVFITSPDGWHFVDSNPGIFVAVAAQPELAAQRAPREGMTIVVPTAIGDRGTTRRTPTAGSSEMSDISIDRLKPSDFDRALTDLGLDPSDAGRLASSTGRSWSVFRRVRAVNPAIANPAWLHVSETRSLTTLCLTGSWDAAREGDRLAIQSIANRPYEDIERDLLRLASVDDAPVLKIGSIWKSKSALELLHLCGPYVTAAELDRFFETVGSILKAPDPVLELPDDQRFAAAIYDKIRAESGPLLESLCDSLIRLAVRGSTVQALTANAIEPRVARLVSALLENTDATRWLSLSGLLRQLAEAAPNEFLTAIEKSLTQGPPAVLSLFDETKSTALWGRCWYAGLLWALEILAWSPERLGRVALVLAKLSHAEIKANWANSPFNTLLSLFRAWMPQTAAEVEERIRVLDAVIKADAEIGWKVLCELTLRANDMAGQNARPAWREDDRGAGQGATNLEFHQMRTEAAKRLMALAPGYPERIARLMEDLGRVSDEMKGSALEMAREIGEPQFGDGDRERIRASLRKYINWHRNFDKLPSSQLEKKLAKPEEIYRHLTPKDAVVRHGWLFEASWLELPKKENEDFETRARHADQLRSEAMTELLSAGGLTTVTRLAEASKNPYLVGWTFAKATEKDTGFLDWVTDSNRNLRIGSVHQQFAAGVLANLPQSRREALIDGVAKLALEQQWLDERKMEFLIAAPCDANTWSRMNAFSGSVETLYWEKIRPGYFRGSPADLGYLVGKLLNAKRPRTAFQSAYLDFEKIDTRLLSDVLDGIKKGLEPEGPIPDGWRVGEALDLIELKGGQTQSDLAALEFGFFSLLQQSKRGPKALYNELSSAPGLFAELITLVYPPKHSEAPPPNEAARSAVQMAWRVLNDWKRLPGIQGDGKIDAGKFRDWIEEARRLCKQADRVEVAETKIGRVLGHAPVGSDGVRPCEPVRELLNDPAADDLRDGFVIGAINKRGSTSRAMGEGGGQERTLAEDYKKHVSALQSSHPYAASAVQKIVASFEHSAVWHDVQARLRDEER